MPGSDVLLWILTALLMAAGLAGAVLPVLPGAALVLTGALLGAKKVGASRLALVGAAVGTVAGLMFGIVGVFVLPFIGAALGEYIARRDHQAAARVGLATGVGLLLALVAKVVIAFMMIGVFVAALVL